MTEVLSLLSDLRHRGITLWAQGDELRYRVHSGPLSAREVWQLRAHKREILRLLAPSAAPAEKSLPIMLATDRQEPMPLSFAQQRLWFLLQMEGVSEAYHIPLGFRLEGELDERALSRALETLVTRHESLRTRFTRRHGEGFQHIDPPEVGLALRRHDLSDAPDVHSALSALLSEEAAAPFDLEHAPAVRARLIRLAPQEHVLLITLHHISADGWSLGVLMRELSLLYRAFRQGEPDPLPPLSIQYADYAAWQRQWLTGERLSEQSLYWRETLTGAPTFLELPTDRPRPDQQRFDGAIVSVDIDEVLTAAIKALSRRCGITLFMTVLAGWAMVLAQLSGQDDILIGTPTANRTRTELEGLIGLFVNTLALRINFSGHPTIKEFLSRTSRAVLEAQDHQDLPFEQVVELTRPTRSPAHTPLFQVMLAWQNNDPATVDLEGLEVTEIPTGTATAKYDLTLDLAESEGRIVGVLNYATALWNPTTAERYVGYFRCALAQMVADVHQQADAADLLSVAERRQLVVEWNATAAPFAMERCAHELFEEQARRTPEAIALVDGAKHLTYDELNRTANQLAHALEHRGVGPDQPVALFVESGIERVIGLLGILKAGGAYLPLDPKYPSERLAYFLKDAAPRVVLTRERLRSALPTTEAVVISLDDGLNVIGSHAAANLDPRSLRLTSRHLAYVIYTSGSTGEPKAVTAEHRGLVNRITAQQAIHAYSHEDICCQKTSIGFVDAVFETLGPLSYGRPLVMAPRAATQDVEQLAALIEHEHITRLVTVPSLAASLLENARCIPLLQSLRSWTLSGEELRADLVLQLQALLPMCRVINLYGSSEVAADATCYDCQNFVGARVPIGRPIANTQIYVLNRALRPVPIGVTGEIYVGGVGVARGYLNRPTLTAASFLDDPFSSDPRARLYKSGDLGRWRSDGVIEYLGRNDHQVKIRGSRIELAEIEAQLKRHEQVTDAVVLAREDTPGEKRLVAYVTSRKGRTLAAQDLRTHLKACLPEVMIPAAFVVLDSFPLLPSGKLDRRALPPPSHSDYASRRYEAPQGEVEEALAAIWQRLLGVARIGRHDNFFELGGHSLHGAKVIASIEERFGIRPSVVAVFQYPTLRELALGVQSLRLSQGGAGAHHEIEIEDGFRAQLLPHLESGAIPRPGLRTAPLTFSQLAHWKALRLFERPSLRDVAIMVRVRGRLDLGALRNAVRVIVDRHDALRTQIVLREGTPVAEVAPSREYDLGIDDLTGLSPSAQDAEVNRLIETHLLQPIDVARDPLFLYRLLRLAEDDHRLIVAIDHLISDALSLQILLRELLVAYPQALQGKPISLPTVSLQFSDYAAWQRSAHPTWVQRHGPYWDERLAKCARVRFPTDPTVSAQTGRGWSSAPFTLESTLTAPLRDWCRRRGTTLVLAVLTAYVGLVRRWCGTSDMVVRYQIAGRDNPNVRNTIGYFATTLCLRIQGDETDSLVDLLPRVTEELCRAYEHADDAYLEAQTPRRDCTFNTRFNWIPLSSTLELSPLEGSDEMLECSLVPFEDPTLRRLDIDEEPSIVAVEYGDEIAGHVYFPLDRFSSGTMETIVRNFQRLVRSLLRDPAALLQNIALEP